MEPVSFEFNQESVIIG